MKGYIYFLWENSEHNIYYIGSTVNPKTRFYDHRRDLPIYDESKDMYVRKYKENIGISILEELEFTDRNNLFELEAYWIYQIRAWGFNLVNCTIPKPYKNTLLAFNK